jgi:exopolysaccharide biosynthesis polyprenyl glycosylphosphotransferase
MSGPGRDGDGAAAIARAAAPRGKELPPAASVHHGLGRSSELRGDSRGYILRRVLAASDIAGLIIAWVVVQALLLPIFGRTFSMSDQLIFALMLPLWTYVGSLLGLYHLPDRRLDHSVAEEFGPVALTATVWSWAFILTRAAFENGSIEVFPSVALWATAVATIIALRGIVRSTTKRRAWYKQRVFLIGSPHDVRRVTRRIKRHPEYGLVVVRILSLDDGGFAESLSGAKAPAAVPEAEALTEIIALSGVHRVMIATPPADSEARSALVRRLRESQVHIDLIVGDPDVFASNTVLHHVEGLPVFTIPAVDGGRAWAALKRSIDIAASAAGLLALSPLLAYCALRIRIGSEGPVFFRQQRIGRHGEPFEVLKLRTMVTQAEAHKKELEQLNVHRGTDTPGMFKIPDDPRVTSFGRTLRRYSLDELPQLWHVLTGEMSLVGPRPLIPEEAKLVDGDYSQRSRMRPGITGPWQTQGRSDIGFADMVKLDYTYVTNWSLSEDFRLLLRTVGAVFHGRGAY